ncbi:transcription termination factor Rho [Nocardioides sp. GXQ0305]|uniref:transcription termination factor Rho n=1 Tax=Nocardioides sp. GXQ0305 TaxID=3423912 RepID=UPI003D7DF6C4
MAGGLGISGAGSMKKAELVSAIKAAQSGGSAKVGGRPDRGQQRDAQDKNAQDKGAQDTNARDKGKAKGQDKGQDKNAGDRDDTRDDGQRSERQDRGDRSQNTQARDRDQHRDRQQGQNQQGQNQQGQNQQNQGSKQDNRQDSGSSRSSRRRRGRDRSRGSSGSGQRSEPDTTVLDDDVLLPAAGILDVLDNYAFVRTSGYLPGADDVYLSLSMVRKYGLRRGDAVVGQVRQPREGERREKFNPMVRIDSVNGADPEAARTRVEFAKLTPLYPSERLRLETEPGNLIGRVIDLASPIGKGQRGLIVSPAKAGKTMIMQSIANSITTNNPECHLMVVLVDERPEEVTDFERSVKGEVISSTFDRPASDHTTVAELAIERAKRLVELGHDVVVLLDGITRLGRAYNLAAPASGRILSGGVDSAALYPPKRFFGAARNIENGGSLTILATALIESGSKMDEVIFEEFKGTGNMEIRLRRDFADKRLFPAIDAVQSGTRREELLMSKDEMAIVWKLRRLLAALDGQQALELLLERLKKSQTNIEFLMQVQKTTPSTQDE